MPHGGSLPLRPGLPSPSLSTPPIATGAQMYGFGMHLFQLGDYYRAITELKRFTLLFPQHPQYPAAQILLGLALQEDSQYEEAADYFQRLERQQDDMSPGGSVQTRRIALCPAAL